MQQLIRFIVLLALVAAAILFFLLGIVVFTYLFIIGFAVGLGVYIVAIVKQKWAASKKPLNSNKSQKTTGRIIDSDDWKELK